MDRQDKKAVSPRGTGAAKTEKKHYHVVRKNKADTKLAFRGIVCAYLLYLAWQLVTSGGTEAFPPAAGWLTGGLFAAAAAGFGIYAWKEYKAALLNAELTPEEEEELRREREEEE